ncbi:MAG: hypothetical protein Alpg2KO_19540 [Alphaproteobacteria bacterium]
MADHSGFGISDRLRSFFSSPLRFVQEGVAEAGTKGKRWIAILLTVVGLSTAGGVGVANWDQLPAETRIAIEETASQIGEQAYEIRRLFASDEEPAQVFNRADQIVDGTELRYARITGSDLTGATLRNIDLSGASVTDTRLSNASFDSGRLTGASFEGITAANLRFGPDVHAVNASIHELRGPGLIVEGSAFTFGKITESYMPGARIENADMRGVTADWVDLRNARVIGGQWTDADLTNLDLRGAGIRDANMYGVALANSAMDRTVMLDVNMDEAEWRDLRFTNGQIEGVSLRDARIYGGSFEGTTLRGIDFTGAIIDGTDFTGARIDQDQTFDRHTLLGARNLDKAVIVDAAGNALPHLMLTRDGIAEVPPEPATTTGASADQAVGPGL